MAIMKSSSLAKVPAITLGFWIIKILATTLGETGGDAVSMSMGLGYLTGSAIFLFIFCLAVVLQIRKESFSAPVYWFAIIASTTVGTTLADFADRSLGIGYPGGATLLYIALIASLTIWYLAIGSVNVSTINTPKAEMFYWVTIMISQTLGTALGDWTADTAGLGYVGAAGIFCAALLLIIVLYFATAVSRVFLFWAAFILTRPLGAVIGDFLDKPLAEGGLELSRISASAVLLTVIVILIMLLPQRAATHSH